MGTIGVWTTIAGAGGLVLAAGLQTAPDRAASEGVFSRAQAERGAVVYLKECSNCHGDRLAGGEGTPPLVGPEFNLGWYGHTVGELFDLIRTSMPPPPDVPGRLTPKQYVDVVAFMLSVHEFPAGKTELTTDVDELMRIRLDGNRTK